MRSGETNAAVPCVGAPLPGPAWRRHYAIPMSQNLSHRPPDHRAASNRAPYGRHLLPLWPFEPDCLYLTHGTYGATPKAVLAAQARWRQAMEAQPVRFMQRELPPALNAAHERLAEFLGVAAKDLAFVENATSGVSAVLRSLDFAPGDEILTTSHVYPAVRKALQLIAQRSGARVIEAAIPFPAQTSAEIEAAVAPHFSPKTKLLLLDLITSPSALILPVAALAKRAKAVGAKVFVDAAHAPGMIELAPAKLGADWVTGNAHKWLFAPRGCAFLWADPQAQEGLHPTAISHGFGQGFRAEFDWVGTRDMTAYLAIGDAIDFYQAMGSAEIRRHNHALADQGAQLIAAALGSEIGQGPTLRGAMASIRLPGRRPTDRDGAHRLSAELWATHRIEVPFIALDGGLWVRISAQIYNEIGDYERLAAALTSSSAR